MNEQFYKFLNTYKSILLPIWMSLGWLSEIREYFDDNFESFAMEIYVNLP